MKPASRTLKWRWLAVVLMVAAGLDYNGFRHQAATARSGDLTGVDGIVALTGGSGLRMQAAVDLLEQGVGDRLLISGVNPAVPKADIIVTAGGSAGLYACCIDIGYEATTTEENADEVSAWAKAHGYRRIALVTSNYHLPRARASLKSRAPDLEVVDVPVVTRIDPRRAFSHWRSFRGTVTEWLKWRVTQALSLIN